MHFIVFMERSLLPNALRPFQIYCHLPNLGITRTWICRLNFTQRLIFFQAWGSFTSLKSQTRDPSLKSLPENLCLEFLRPEKVHRPQQDLNPRTLDLEASTLPRDHRGRFPFFLTFISLKANQCITNNHILQAFSSQSLRVEFLLGYFHNLDLTKLTDQWFITNSEQ